jgi:hypothetical protein
MRLAWNFPGGQRSSSAQRSGGIGFPGSEFSGASECLNGSLVYLPALLAMAIVGGLLADRKHPAAPFILWAALIFAISVTFRSLDLALCDAYQIQGRKIGTHFAWHLLNGLALFLLLRASLGRARSRRVPDDDSRAGIADPRSRDVMTRARSSRVAARSRG